MIQQLEKQQNTKPETTMTETEILGQNLKNQQWVCNTSRSRLTSRSGQAIVEVVIIVSFCFSVVSLTFFLILVSSVYFHTNYLLEEALVCKTMITNRDCLQTLRSGVLKNIPFIKIKSCEISSNKRAHNGTIIFELPFQFFMKISRKLSLKRGGIKYD